MKVPEILVEKLRTAGVVVAFTGAGVSAESGIPTFREAQTGLWSQYDPLELATPEAFKDNPSLVWDWYSWRRSLIRSAQPNPAHIALAQIENKTAHFTLITQNIDNLHREAGSRNILELHGNINRNKCFPENKVVEQFENNKEGPPRCPDCGGPIRPDVVWFNESLPPIQINKAFSAAQSAEIFLSIGTSALVHPAAKLPFAALQMGAFLVEINPSPTPLSQFASLIVRQPAGVFLPELVNEVWVN